MSQKQKNPYLEDDEKESIPLLLEHRLPWLIIGLGGGIIATIFASRFEEVLSHNIHLAYFIPVIVYMADAVETQTETIYTRNLGREKVLLSVYLLKELLLGILLGLLFGMGIGLFAFIWFHSLTTAFTVGLAMAMSIVTAPLVALLIPTILQRSRIDPAVGGGPFATVIQDLISLLIYFTIASFIILR